MARKMLFATSIVALALMLSGASFANPVQVNFGPSSSGWVSITSSAVAFNSVSGLANQGSLPTGTFSISDASINTTGYSAGTYTLAANTEVLSVNINGDSMTGDLSLATVTPVGNVALFIGTYTVTSATWGFTSTGYPVGAVVDVDFTTYKGGVSAGEIIPDPVPEPGTFALVGSGLIALAGVLRRKL